MYRISPIAPSELSSDQQEVHDGITSSAEKAFGDTFTLKRPDGALLGPFPALLHSKGAGAVFMTTATELGKLQGLSPTARETAIIATGSQYQAAYELYAHERYAAARTNLSREQIDAIKVGRKPQNLDQECSIAFDVAIELVKKPGPLSRANWDEAISVLGREGTLALVHYVGFYAYTCLLMNGCDVPLPEGEVIL